MFPNKAGKDSIWVSSDSLDDESGRKLDLHNYVTTAWAILSQKRVSSYSLLNMIQPQIVCIWVLFVLRIQHNVIAILARPARYHYDICQSQTLKFNNKEA